MQGAWEGCRASFFVFPHKHPAKPCSALGCEDELPDYQVQCPELLDQQQLFWGLAGYSEAEQEGCIQLHREKTILRPEVRPEAFVSNSNVNSPKRTLLLPPLCKQDAHFFILPAGWERRLEGTGRHTPEATEERRDSSSVREVGLSFLS